MDLVEAQARGDRDVTRHPWERARVELIATLVRSEAPLAAGDVVLDIGCGDTFVVEHFARAYPAVQFYAIDSAFTPALIAAFRSKMALPNVALFSSLDEVPVDRPARLVLLMDVIEHVPDDIGMLRDVCARRCVGPESRLLITVPSYQSLFSSHDVFLGHYRRYSRSRLRATLEAVGLRPVMDGYLFGSLVPLRFVQVVREKLSRKTATAHGVASWTGGDAVARTVAQALVTEGRLALWLARAGIRLPGLSTIAVCERSV